MSPLTQTAPICNGTSIAHALASSDVPTAERPLVHILVLTVSQISLQGCDVPRTAIDHDAEQASVPEPRGDDVAHGRDNLAFGCCITAMVPGLRQSEKCLPVGRLDSLGTVVPLAPALTSPDLGTKSRVLRAHDSKASVCWCAAWRSTLRSRISSLSRSGGNQIRGTSNVFRTDIWEKSQRWRFQL